MIKFKVLILLFIFFLGCSQKKEIFDDYAASIKEFQYEMNKSFADKEESPLTNVDIENFKSLDFFPIDSTYRVHAQLVLEENPIYFEMSTTTDRKQMYKTFGTAKFKLDGRDLKLHIYQNQELIKDPKYKNHLFIPFTDKTNSIESYGGGRYIDLEVPEGNTIIIDFNTAYNPYCAYNHKYSCPIPPRENDLDIAIKAGVKDFKK